MKWELSFPSFGWVYYSEAELAAANFAYEHALRALDLGQTYLDEDGHMWERIE